MCDSASLVCAAAADLRPFLLLRRGRPTGTTAFPPLCSASTSLACLSSSPPPCFRCSITRPSARWTRRSLGPVTASARAAVPGPAGSTGGPRTRRSPLTQSSGWALPSASRVAWASYFSFLSSTCLCESVSSNRYLSGPWRRLNKAGCLQGRARCLAPSRCSADVRGRIITLPASASQSPLPDS